MKKKIKKTSLRQLEKKADRLTQLFYVPLNPKCLVCGGKTSEMHHYILKSQSNNLRYDKNNLVPLCRSCHAKHHLSGDPVVIATILKIKGQGWDDDLQKRRHDICKINKGYLQEIISFLSPHPKKEEVG